MSWTLSTGEGRPATRASRRQTTSGKVEASSAIEVDEALKRLRVEAATLSEFLADRLASHAEFERRIALLTKNRGE